MRHYTASDFKTMPWKNGGGSTTEMAVFPPGATLDNFDWRISSALVAESGPFSHFPGIDRSLIVLDGCMRLTSLEHDLGMLTPDSAPCRFAGELPVYAGLPGGRVTDLNVMSRRSRYSHHVQVLRGETHALGLADAAQAALYCAHGGATVHLGADSVRLQAGELLLLDRSLGDPLDCTVAGSATSLLYLIRFSHAGGGDYVA